MKSIFKILTSKWFLLLLAWLLVAIVIWYGGPYLALGEWVPFESAFSRLVAIAALVVLWIARGQLRKFRGRRAGSRLAGDVSAQATKAQSKGSAEAAQLRAQFEEALGALRSSKGKSINLYELPWYIIIGPPGAGKTTVIANSGLNFPLSKKFGKAALRGVGGTRNCDWWFTDEAVLLDTAGRYTTQDSDGESDHAGWTEFLGLLRKHRGRRPINGVIVAISAMDLLSMPESERRRHVEAVRHRLEELGRELKITLPVYFLLTKLDLIAGFSEFFDDLTQEGRAQVWGTTFAIELSRSGAAPTKVSAEFDLLVERLNARLMLRMQSERDVRRRAVIFTFPQQFAALRRALVEFTSEAFSFEEQEPKTQLRGVYFTSGTQEGTPIDRMLSALARTFGLNMKSALAPPREGRAYFIQRLLKEILFKESGLAGVNQRMELRQMLLNVAAYAGVVLLIVVALVVFSISYRLNREYLAGVHTAAEALDTVRPADTSNPLITGLDRMDAFRQVLDVARHNGESIPWSMRWGLYQGNSVGNAAEDAYLRELNANMLPVVAQHFHGRLAAYAGEPDKLYEYLKAYLMLVMPEHLDPEQMSYIGTAEWQRIFENDPGTFERVKTHFNALITDPDRVQPVREDTAVVERARNSLKQASLPVLMYSRLKLNYADDEEHAINLARDIGLGAEGVFVRKSGKTLSEPVPALYTKPVFKEVTTTAQGALVKQFVDDKWLLGGDIGDLVKSPLLSQKLIEIYEDDYIRAWDELLNDLTLKPANNTRDSAQMWQVLAASSSPMKGLLTLVQTNTMLVEAKPDALTKAKGALGGAVGSLGKIIGQDKKPAAPPGTKVTKHFEMLHKLLAGNPPPIDATLQKFGSVQSAMAETNVLGGAAPLEKAPQLSGALQDLQAHARTLPAPVGDLIARASGAGSSVVAATIGNDFSARYQQQVVSECQELAAGRYPLSVSSAVDLPLADFGRVFAPNGTFDSFFRSTMQTFVDSNRPQWRWKPEAVAIGGSAFIPAQFQRASKISQTYFGPGSADPQVRFTVTPDFLDAAAARMTLEIDGQTLDYRHGPQRAVPMVWPGPSPGQAAISLEERAGGRPNFVESGSWALFRLLGHAEFKAQGETRFLATFNLGGRTVRLIFQANSSRNPFARDLLHGFRCKG